MTSMEYITLGQASKIAPGRPSANALWRWCRKGIAARGGGRIRMEHVRIGGKLFTTKKWVDAFGLRVAEADAKHFDKASSAAGEQQERSERLLHLDEVERELEGEGL